MNIFWILRLKVTITSRTSLNIGLFTQTGAKPNYQNFYVGRLFPVMFHADFFCTEMSFLIQENTNLRNENSLVKSPQVFTCVLLDT